MRTRTVAKQKAAPKSKSICKKERKTKPKKGESIKANTMMNSRQFRKHIEKEHSVFDWLEHGFDVFKLADGARLRDRGEMICWLVDQGYLKDKRKF